MAARPALRAALPGLRRTLRCFRPHVRGQRRLVAGGLAAMVAEVLLRLLEPWPLKFVFDRLLVPAAEIGFLGGLSLELALATSALAVVVITGLRAGTAYLSTVAFALAGNRVLTAVRAQLFDHLHRLHLGFHRSARSGDLLTRLTSDIGRLQEVTVTAALPLTGNVLTLIGMVAVMVWMDPWLTLAALAGFPLFVFSLGRLGGRIRLVARRQRETEGALATTAAESLGAIEVVQAYGLENELSDHFRAHNTKSMKDGVKGKRLSAGLERRTDLIVAVGTGIVMFAGARLVWRGGLTPGDLIVFMTYLKSAFKPLRDVAKYAARLSKAAASGERIVDLFEIKPEVVDAAHLSNSDPSLAWSSPAPGTQPSLAGPGRARGEIAFQVVTFRYGRSVSPALDHVSFHVAAGTNVGVLGPSGAGKSSLMALLLRLADPDRGRILLDGHDLRDVPLQWLRAQIAIVLQDSVLFATTVRDNIRYGRLHASHEDIEEAARLANAHDFVTRLPQGYDTVLGERGATLSGGQRQRIALARAAVRRARIVVLDEPTTGLDEESEAVVMDALRRVTAGCTTFHITHDARTVADADVTFYLDDGRLTAHPCRTVTDALAG